MKHLLFILQILALSLSSFEGYTQESAKDNTQIQILTTKRGDNLTGRILLAQDSSLTFLFKQDTLFFHFDEIVKIEFLDDPEQVTDFYDKQNKNTVGLKIRPDMHGQEQVFISPTAFNLKKGEGEYRNTMFSYNTVEYGITNNWSFGTGVVLPIFLQVNTKYSFEAAKGLRLGIGNYFFLSTLQFNNDIPTFDYLYGVCTLGKPEAFFNFSGGYYIPFDRLDESRFVMTFGGGFRVGRQWRLNSEFAVVFNQPATEGGLIPNLIAGWFNQNNRIDFGFFVIPTDFAPIPIPTFSYSRRFR